MIVKMGSISGVTNVINSLNGTVDTKLSNKKLRVEKFKQVTGKKRKSRTPIKKTNANGGVLILIPILLIIKNLYKN